MIFKTQNQLDSALAHWQQRLRLGDWRVSATIRRRADLTPDAAATIRFNHDKRAAEIRLLDPRDYDTDWQWPQDHEKSLVHELLHLVLSFSDSLAKQPPGRREQEFAIERLASALVGR